MKLSSFHLFGKTFCSPPLKFSTCSKVGSRVVDSRYYVEKYQRKRVACHCYQKLRQSNFVKKNFGKCFLIGCFKAGQVGSMESTENHNFLSSLIRQPKNYPWTYSDTFSQILSVKNNSNFIILQFRVFVCRPIPKNAKFAEDFEKF